MLVAALVIGGAPLVARALGDDPAPGAAAVPQALRPEATVPSIPPVVDLGADIAPTPPPATPSAATPPEPENEPEDEPETPLEAVTRVLTAAYTWDERSARVEELQFLLGIPADGWYSAATLSAHRSAMASSGLPVDLLPVPAGPAPEQWAALRQCESNGDYTITNPSGKYRGAYQFDRSTWDSVAGRHDPSLVGVDPAAASPADQDAMALALYIERGARPWPHCGRHLR